MLKRGAARCGVAFSTLGPLPVVTEPRTEQELSLKVNCETALSVCQPTSSRTPTGPPPHSHLEEMGNSSQGMFLGAQDPSASVWRWWLPARLQFSGPLLQNKEKPFWPAASFTTVLEWALLCFHSTWFPAPNSSFV